MDVRNIVKVMNFHSLIKVNSARRKVSDVLIYEAELKQFISSIINNKNLILDKQSVKMNKNGVDLNIYIGSDFGFCASFNSDVYKILSADDEKNDIIIIGKKIKSNAKNVAFYCDKDSFYANQLNIHRVILKGLTENKYRSINIIYIKYINFNSQVIEKKQILPVEFDSDSNNSKIVDYTVEGDIEYIINGLISTYVLTEVKMCEASSWASENVQRQAFTTQSLNKIDENMAQKRQIERKKINYEKNKKIAEMNNFKKNKGDC